jgi:hypothetical protein
MFDAAVTLATWDLSGMDALESIVETGYSAFFAINQKATGKENVVE